MPFSTPGQRAAIYVRVSTDSDAQKDSPDNQIATCKEYAQEHDMTVSSEFIYNDAGVSGTEMEQRREVQRLLHDARCGRFDVVLFVAISRFSRDLSDALQMKKRLETVYGIRMVSIEEGYDSAIDGRNSEMVFTVHAMLAAHKSQEMSKAIQRGLRQSAKRGRHTGNIAPFGYAKGSDGRLRLDPMTAPIVVDIFQMYQSGLGCQAIARILNDRHVPTASVLAARRETLWQASTVRNMLRNPVYIGTIVAHRYTSLPDVTQSRQADSRITRLQTRDEDEWISVEHAHPSIVDLPLFSAVQSLMDDKSQNKGLKQTSNLLAGKLYCRECQSKMVIVSSRPRKSRTYRYIVCSRVRRLGPKACENHAKLRYEDVIGAVLQQLQAQLLSCANEIAPLVSVLLQATERGAISGTSGAEAASRRLYTLEQELARNLKAQRNNLEAMQQGLFSPAVIENSQAELRRAEAYLRAEMERLSTEDIDKTAAVEAEQNKALETVVSRVITLADHLHEYTVVSQRRFLDVFVAALWVDHGANVDVLWTWRANHPAVR